MSDTSQGPGWWQASDGKWYPPEQAPAAAASAPQAPGPAAAPGTAKEAKASAKAAKAHAKALRPWYKKKRFILPLGFVVLMILIVAAGGGGSEDEPVASGGDAASEDDGNDNTDDVDTNSGNTDNPPQNDVEITACTSEDFTGPEAQLSVTNNSSKRSTYSIEVSFETEDGATQYGTAVAFINNLEPGQTKTEEAVSFEEVPDGTQFKCRLVEVDRYAS